MAPVAPVVPVAPAGPVAPVAPAGPCSPTFPCAPAAAKIVMSPVPSNATPFIFIGVANFVAVAALPAVAAPNAYGTLTN